MPAHPEPPAAETPPVPPLVTTLAWALVAHPWKVVLLALLCSAVGGGLAWFRLTIETDRMALIGEQHEYNRNFTALQHDFGDVDAMVVVLSAAKPQPARDRQLLREAADRLAEKVRARPRELPDVFYRLPTEAPDGKALLFLETADIEEVEARLRAAKPVLSSLFRGGLGSFFSAAAAQIAGLTRREEPEQAERAYAILLSFAAGLESALAGEESAERPWLSFAPTSTLADERDGYLWTQDGRLVLLVQPQRSPNLDAEASSVGALRRLMEEVEREAPGVVAQLTGGPVLEVDELETFRRDAAVATVASLLGVMLLVGFAFRRVLGPLLATGSLLTAVLSTLGFAALWPGHLNLISMAFCALMIGLGVDYAIHLISRFDEERSRGLGVEDALRGALARTGQAIAGGAFTTALAFLATLFTDVEGIREFGVVAGVGVLLCLVANLVVLPALVVLADRSRGGRTQCSRLGWPRSRLAVSLDALIERRHGAVVVASLLLAAASAVYAAAPDGGGRAHLRYDSNLLALQAQGLESVRLAREILDDPGLGGMFAAIVIRDRERLPDYERAVRALPTVSGTDSILDVVRDQPAKLVVLARLAQLLAEIDQGSDPGEAHTELQRLERLDVGLEALVESLEGVARGALQSGEREATDEVLALQERLERLTSAGGRSDPARGARLARYEAGLRSDLAAVLGRLAEECATTPVEDRDLPEGIRDRFVGRSGAYLLRVYPRDDVWSGDTLARFVEELREVAPDVSGMPVQLYESDRLMRRGYTRAGEIALAFVIFYLILHFRGLLAPFVATATLLVGACWGVGLMALLGVGVNPANLLAIPLTLGIGIDYAIHLVHRDREARRFPSLAGSPAILATSTGRAVLLSSATTLLGFGALCLSSHRGVASIGWTLCLAILASLAAAFSFCPALLRWLQGPAQPLTFEGRGGPKTGPGGEVIRPGEDPRPEDR